MQVIPQSIIILLFLIFPNLVQCEEYRLSAIYFPIYDVDADIDEDEDDNGIEFHHDLIGQYGAALKISRVKQTSSKNKLLYSVVYHQAKYLEDDNDVRSHALYFELTTEQYFSRHNIFRPYMGLTFGAGAVKFEFLNNQNSEWGGASKIGVQMGILIDKKINIGLGMTYFIWGYPSETIGEGGNLCWEMGWTF